MLLTTPSASRTRWLNRLPPRLRARMEEVDVWLDVTEAMHAPTESSRVKRFRRVLENLAGLSTTRRRRLTRYAREKFDRTGGPLARAYEAWKARA